MKIGYIGKFRRLHDEEYIARSFEMLGHTVFRLDERMLTHQIEGQIEAADPDLVIISKLACAEPARIMKFLNDKDILSVCWVFDLYFDYPGRAYRVNTAPCFKADYVVTTDGGHDDRWRKLGINHFCVRQGIYKEECYLAPAQKRTKEIIFVGSDNQLNLERTKVLSLFLNKYKGRFEWFGRADTNEIRGTDLNNLYAQTKIVIGDSVYSPHYWSNRVVETLGRGGFLIHQEVEGIKDEYPDLVTYKRGDLKDLEEKIEYFLTHEKEREEIRLKNFQHVKANYTMDKKCAELLENVLCL